MAGGRSIAAVGSPIRDQRSKAACVAAMPPSNPSKTERKHARKKRKLEERQNSYTQITDWNGDLPSITAEAPPKARITNRYKRDFNSPLFQLPPPLRPPRLSDLVTLQRSQRASWAI